MNFSSVLQSLAFLPLATILLAKAAPISPNLETTHDVPGLEVHSYQNSGAIDHSAYPEAWGTLNVAMIFVDFHDAPASADDTTEAAGNFYTDHGNVSRLFHDQSYGKLDLKFDVRSDLGWRRMPSDIKKDWESYDEHRAYVGAALACYTPAEIDFSHYGIIVVVAPKDAGATGASALATGAAGSGVGSPTGEVRNAVTFGDYKDGDNSLITTVHELGHSLGLPDVYKGSDRNQWPAGSWDIMSDIWRARSFFGFHRHILGWLSEERKLFVKAPMTAGLTTRVMLTPLAGQDGISLLVMDLNSTTRVLVAEVAQQLIGTNNQWWGEGVMVYRVDSKEGSQNGPVEIVPKTTGASDNYGNLYLAPFGVEDTMVFHEGQGSVRMKVLRKVESSYEVEVTYDSDK